MKKEVLFCSLTILAAFLLTCNLNSQDWPQWLGPERNATVTGFKAPASWPAELKQNWKVTVGTGDASPSLSGNRIYLFTRQGGDEAVLCLDAGTGKEIWKSTYPASAVTGPATSHPGPRGTPAVANGKVVTFGATGILSCLDASTGKLIWRKENPANEFPTFFTGTSPLLMDGLCIIYTGKVKDGRILALDLNTGNERWRWTGDGPSYATPAVMTINGAKQLVFQTESNLIGLNFIDGRLLWKVPAAPVQRFYNSASPYVNGQNIYYTGQGNGIKAIRIDRQGDAFSAKELWSNSEVGTKWNTPILKNGYLYGFSDTRRIFCVNATNGQTAWIDPATNSDFSTIVDCGTVLIGLASTGNLIVFNPDSRDYSEVKKYKVSDTPVYAFPVVTGNRIFVKDAESLTLYTIN